MSALAYVRKQVIPAALGMLPERLDSPAARAMLIAIGLQESRFEHRRQIGGPARGFWQFELGGGVRGVRGLIFRKTETKQMAREVLAIIGYRDATAEERYAAIEHNDILACLFARILLWSHPKALPARGEHEYAWEYYIETWRPGKPHRETWDRFYAQAWEGLP